MPDYFDYISESSEVDIDDDDDALDVYDEMDASMCEFDSYVQEGVGLKIAAGVGGAALIAGLIALIAKCFGKSSASSAARAAKDARKALDKVDDLPEEGVEILTDKAIEESKKNVVISVFDYAAACKAIMNGEEIPSTNPVSQRKKENDTFSYQAFNDTKINVSDISVSIDKYNEKASKKAKSDESVQKLIDTRRAGRRNKPGTKITTDKAEAKETLVHIEQVSNEIDQKRKDLQAIERDLTEAENSGRVKITPEQRKVLEKKRARAANAVSQESMKLKAPSMGILSAVKMIAKDLFSSPSHKSRKSKR